jgi:hypothetical protein
MIINQNTTLKKFIKQTNFSNFSDFLNNQPLCALLQKLNFLLKQTDFHLFIIVGRTAVSTKASSNTYMSNMNKEQI